MCFNLCLIDPEQMLSRCFHYCLIICTLVLEHFPNIFSASRPKRGPSEPQAIPKRVPSESPESPKRFPSDSQEIPKRVWRVASDSQESSKRVPRESKESPKRAHRFLI